MQALPDSPNLDHLRQQAKDLLPWLRSVRPGASLSDAQAAVAERYGFRTWPDLKAEVDRRSAQPAAAAPDGTASALAAAFGLGEPAGPMAPLVRQWAGQAWVLTTGRGRWLARRLFDWHDARWVEVEVGLAEAAAQAGVRTLLPLRSPAGNIVEVVEGARWRVLTLPALGPELSTPADPRDAATAGRILATVHALGLAPPAPVSSWVSRARGEAEWRQLHEGAAAGGMPWADRLAEAIPALLALYRGVEPVDAAGAVVLSGCWYPPGAFCTAGPDELVLTSWEHAGAIPVRWDFGSTLAAWSAGTPGAVNEAAARAFVAGYASVAAVPVPLTSGIFTAAICAELSWLSSRIRLSLDHEHEDRRAAAEREVPWLLERLPAAATFEAVLGCIAAAPG